MNRKVILYRDLDIQNSELNAMKHNFISTSSRMDIRSGDLVIGRYSVLPFYKEQERDIDMVGGKLINSYSMHHYSANVMEWYQDLKELTPESWTMNDFVHVNDNGPFIVKGSTNSRKHKWNTHMFALSKQDVGAVAYKLSEDSLIGQQDIIVRKYVDLKLLLEGINGLPITREFRVFVAFGEILSKGFYWSSHIEELKELYPLYVFDPSCIPTDFLHDAISRIKNKINFFAIDVAQTEYGNWIVVEINDGQMAGLSENNPDELYGNLKQTLE